MYMYQWVLISSIFALLFNKAARVGAFYILCSYIVYMMFYPLLDGIYYYSFSAAINLCLGAILHDKNRLAALCSYMLVFANLIGFIMWYTYQKPAAYDIACSILLIAQAISIIPGGKSNGLRYYLQYIALSLVSFNRRKQSVTITKTQQKK